MTTPDQEPEYDAEAEGMDMLAQAAAEDADDPENVSRSTPPAPEQQAPIRDDKGWYHTPHGDFLSVTTMIEGGVPKPGLVHWAGIEVARCAVEHIPYLSRLRGETARAEAYEWLRRAAERRRDDAADLGSSLHDVYEAHVLGAPKPSPTDLQAPFFRAFAQFLDDHQPRFHAAEMVVANPDDQWCGKLDVVMELPRLCPDAPVLLTGDWKTGKKVYDEAALQLSAYRRATVGWLKDGTEVEPIATERAVVVHIRPDVHAKTGGYRIYQIDTSDEVYRSFLAARDVALTWTRREKKRAVTVWDLKPVRKTAA